MQMLKRKNKIPSITKTIIKPNIGTKPQEKVELKNFFSDVYKNKMWGNGDGLFYSGVGSNEVTEYGEVLYFINMFIAKNKIKSLLDFGCGDFNFGKQINVNKYYGVDIVQELIDYNKSKFEDDNHKFILVNDDYSELPKVDLIICKEVFQHIDNSKVKEIISKLLEIEHKYILVINALHTANAKIKDSYEVEELISGKNGEILLNNKPFNFDSTFLCYLKKGDESFSVELIK